jgi:hypothetical protein
MIIDPANQDETRLDDGLIEALFEPSSTIFYGCLSNLDLPDRFLLEYISFGRICYLFLSPTK